MTTRGRHLILDPTAVNQRVLHVFSLVSSARTQAHLIPRVPDKALPVAGDGDELVSVVCDELAPQQLALGVDLQLSYRFVSRDRRGKENQIVVTLCWLRVSGEEG